MIKQVIQYLATCVRFRNLALGFLLLIIGHGFNDLMAQTNFDLANFEAYRTQNPEQLLKAFGQNHVDKLSEVETIYLFIHTSNQLGNYVQVDSAVKYAFKNIEFENDSLAYFEIAKNHAIMKKVVGKYSEAMNINYDLLDFAQNKNDTLRIIEIQIAMGELYRASSNIKLGLDYLEKAEYLIKRVQPQPLELLASAYNRRAALFFQFHTEYDSVIALSKKCIDIARRIGDLNLEATSCNELGALYISMKPELAEGFLKRAIEIWEQLEMTSYVINGKRNLGRLYRETFQYDKGIRLLMDEFDRLETPAGSSEKGRYYEVLSDLHAGKGEFEMAYEYSNNAKEIIIDQAYNQYAEQLALLSAEFEAKKKEKELLEKQKEIDLAKLEKERSEREQTYLFILLTVASLIAVLLLVVSIFINNQRLKLSEQKTTIAETNEQLKDLVAQKESLLQEVNHRVKNNLSVLSGLMYLQQSKLSNKEAIQALKDSQDRITTISLIHESLYQRGDMSVIKFQGYLENLVSYILESFNINENEVTINIDCKQLNTNLSKSIPLAMLINELITNSFKYAFENVAQPELGISFDLDKNILTVYDNGPGISVKDQKKNNSLGAELILIFAEQINAKMKVYKTQKHFVNEIQFGDKII